MAQIQKNSLASDNITSVCPAVMNALFSANIGIASSYGSDLWSQQLEKQLSDLFEKSVKVFPVTSGTAANALSLAALTPPYGKVFCHAMSHINTDECGAPEFFTQGAKLIPIESDDGKISEADLQPLIRGTGNVHSTQPATLSIAQSCETGMVYQRDEITAIATMAHNHGLKVHMDGARFANALARLDIRPAEMTWKAGVDVLSFGGTKNGCLAAEAVIFFNHKDVGYFPFIHKRSGQLLSKMRFIAVQLSAYITDDVWLSNARHANSMAERLSKGFSKLGIPLAYETQANAVFTCLPEPVIDYMNAQGFTVTRGELDGLAPPRFVTAWNTTTEEVDALLSITQEAILATEKNAP